MGCASPSTCQAISFDHDAFSLMVGRTLARHGLGAEALEVELTETVAASDPERAACASSTRCARWASGSRSTISAPASPASRRCAGCISTRSRSTASSSADVDAAPRQPGDLPVASIALARGLGIRVLAEGVERHEEYAWLLAHGCDAFPGLSTSRRPLDRRGLHRLRSPTRAALAAADRGRPGGAACTSSPPSITGTRLSRMTRQSACSVCPAAARRMLAALWHAAAHRVPPRSRRRRARSPQPRVDAGRDDHIAGGGRPEGRRSKRLKALLKRTIRTTRQARLLSDSIARDPGRAARAGKLRRIPCRSGDTMLGGSGASGFLGNRLKFYQLARYNHRRSRPERTRLPGTVLRIPGTPPHVAPPPRIEEPRPGTGCAPACPHRFTSCRCAATSTPRRPRAVAGVPAPASRRATQQAAAASACAAGTRRAQRRAESAPAVTAAAPRRHARSRQSGDRPRSGTRHADSTERMRAHRSRRGRIHHSASPAKAGAQLQ